MEMAESKGKVFLVGAGPGDKGLLTLKAQKLIANADVVVYDRLVSRSIMDLVPKSAKLIDVGKAASNHKVTQENINKILLEEALQGNCVIRLKGGDPFVFGRGGEELELLSENGIEFEVVPGITSSIAAAAYAGIPVTHRDFCSSLHIITGHAKKDSELNIDFDALVRLNGTLVFMMSVSTVGQIAKGLLNAGMDSQMPCAVVENGTRGCQRKVISRLDNIEQAVAENEIKSPAVILVGKVCALSDKFDWFSSKPLKGAKILVTQPKKKQSVFADKLENLGAEVVTYPCIETNTLVCEPIVLNKYSVIVFTSDAGVDAFFENLERKNLDARSLAGKKIACVGTKTAAALKRRGITADFIPDVFDGEHLAKQMWESSFITEKDRVMLLRSDIASKEITDFLAEKKIMFSDIPIYETKLITDNPPVKLNEFDYVTFTSGSCVDGFCASSDTQNFAGVQAVCIGEQTAKKAKEHGFEVLVSDKATIDSMVSKLEEIYRKG